MELFKIRVIITAIATLTAIIFIWLSFIFPAYSVLILNIGVILLPTIYIIGNYLSENLLEERYDQIIDEMSATTDKLEEKYNNTKILNIKLKKELFYLKQNV